MRIRLLLLALSCCHLLQAQVFEPADGPRTVRTQGFWNNWYLQAGLDMTLQNPYGYNLAKVFPNGKSFGMDVALGKWFTHQVGVRGKFNWENRLPLLENGHANWLAPFDKPGVNREKGGYIALYGDMLFHLNNLCGTYRPDRQWNTSVYPRIGVNYNFGVSKGSLLAGIGLLSTYRLNSRWSLYGDVAYIMTGSGFVGENESGGTGTGSNSNGYLSMGVGVQVQLGRTGDAQRKSAADDKSAVDGASSRKLGVLTNGIWDNWFVQAGVDMSLLNPYGCDFSQVIPKGTTFGLNVAAGKWFSPEYGLRVRVQWDNGLIENKRVAWVPPVDDPRENHRKGGFATASLDAMLNLTNVLKDYDADRRWHTSAYLRAGVITQFAEGSGSPLMGAGVQETYRLSDRLSLFGSAGYQVTTSEGMGVSTTGMAVSAGTNGFFDVDFGVVLDLGRNSFYRDAATKRQAYAQPQTGHNWPRFMVNTVASVGVAYIGKTALKKMVKEERPDHTDNKSFPSGHAAMAFALARSIDKEFRDESIWIPIAGYAAATAIGVERVVNDRHHWYDVAAGAALGYGAAELTWWLSDKLFGADSPVAVGTSGTTVEVRYAF